MIETIKFENKTITIIGTAHVSKESVEEVNKTIDELKPDTVCVEICQSRFNQIRNINKWRETDIVKIIKSGNSFLLLMNLFLGFYQKKIGDELGVRPGQEMLAACDKAEEVGAKTSLIDREVNITLKRTWGGMSFREKIRLFWELFSSMFASDDQVSSEDIEKMKHKDMISNIMEHVGKTFPNVKNTLIDERDTYMARKITECEGENIVVVVGAGHMSGIMAKIGKEADLDKLNEIPPKKKIWKVLKWILPALILGAIGYGFYRGGTDLGTKLVLIWVITHSVPSAVLCWVAGGGLISTITAFVVSPFTSLNPMIAAGWVVGLVEALVSKPKVSDFEELTKFKLSFSNLKKNRVTKILLVIVFTNIGSSLGTWISGGAFLFKIG